MFGSPDYIRLLEKVQDPIANSKIPLNISEKMLKTAGDYSVEAAQKYISILGGIVDDNVLKEILG
ncbi:MAG: hypothetical protein JW915_21105, partial [Chitinispirillaceae bacterium]|nr:hypothetical protein [Chitinispirillaceae bacterium]